MGRTHNQNKIFGMAIQSHISHAKVSYNFVYLAIVNKLVFTVFCNPTGYHEAYWHAFLRPLQNL